MYVFFPPSSSFLESIIRRIHHEIFGVISDDTRGLGLSRRSTTPWLTSPGKNAVREETQWRLHGGKSMERIEDLLAWILFEDPTERWWMKQGSGFFQQSFDISTFIARSLQRNGEKLAMKGSATALLTASEKSHESCKMTHPAFLWLTLPSSIFLSS